MRLVPYGAAPRAISRALRRFSLCHLRLAPRSVAPRAGHYSTG
ncbi:hypothetical protein A2U01_0069805 [Trifolium medium]|uniref:Uncharacterized protein n=1 Tax=Trifolium medium TaxID=97028 RepID=A0A392SJE6_9FABA|nr:hypothetical protein [Trifolium medium]